MSLQGKRIVITRAAHQARGLAALLRERGATPVLYPCIDIVPPDDTSALDAALRRSDSFAWLVLTSKNTVRILAQRSDALGITPTFRSVAAVGKSTAALFTKYFDEQVTFVPDEQTADGLLRSMPVQPDERLFLPQSELADDALAQGWRVRGVYVTAMTAYRNVIGTGGDEVPALLADQRVDAITFTSSSTVDHFAQRIAPQTASHVPAACIGPSTAQAAREHGYQHIIMPAQYTLDDLVNALDVWFAAQTSEPQKL